MVLADICEGSNPATRTKIENPVAAMVTGFFLCFQWFASFLGAQIFTADVQ